MGALLYPLRQALNHFGVEGAVGGHLEFARLADGLKEEAIGIVRYDRRAPRATDKQRLGGIEPQGRLLLLRTVAAVTMFYEDGANMGFEVRVVVRRAGPRRID